MARCFFDVHDEQFFLDEEGGEDNGLCAARKEARRITP
jgi:hypothetical protein